MKRPGTVVTIGTFDGVHLGHAALVRRAKEIAESVGGATRVVVMTFDPHPAATLAPERVPARLTTLEQRVELLGAAGADEVVRLEPTGNLLSLTPEEFLTHVVADLRPVAIVEGPDFRFGHRRAGDVGTLTALGTAMGYSVEVVPPVEVTLTDGTIARASSTVARWLLENGRMRDLAAVLGRPYEMTGEIVKGDQRGRQIGYPTANLSSPNAAPADGVYAGRATLQDGCELAAAISVGDKPTFEGSARAVEAFLMLDHGKDGPAGPGLARAGPGAWTPLRGLPEYGWTMRLRIEHWVREQVKFDGLEPLLDQMSRDCERVRWMLNHAGAGHKEAACP